jgi:predicted nucleic acid-binding protein
MEHESYYLDTCIWLNLFFKEGDESKGIPYWKIAEDFIKRDVHIIVSTINLKEIELKMDLKPALFLFRKRSITPFRTENEDYTLARKFENQDKTLSFYDYLHVAIALRRKAILITRDKALLAFAKSYMEAYKPEELIY